MFKLYKKKGKRNFPHFLSPSLDHSLSLSSIDEQIFSLKIILEGKLKVGKFQLQSFIIWWALPFYVIFLAWNASNFSSHSCWKTWQLGVFNFGKFCLNWFHSYLPKLVYMCLIGLKFYFGVWNENGFFSHFWLIIYEFFGTNSCLRWSSKRFHMMFWSL